MDRAYGDEEGWRVLTSLFERADAFLLGRKTWEIWEPYWPHHDSGDPVPRINVLPKYVPSTTLKDPAWQNTHVIDGDVEAACASSRRSPGVSSRSTAAANCSAAARARPRGRAQPADLPRHGGRWASALPGARPDAHLELVESRSVPSGVMIQTYRPAGRARFGNAGD